MNDMMSGILKSLGLPAWTPLLALAVVGYIIWTLLQTKSPALKVRRMLKEANFMSGTERKEAEQAVLDLAGDDSDALLVIIQEGLTQGRKNLAGEALDRLEASGAKPMEVKKYAEAVRGRQVTAESESVAVKNLWEGGEQHQARTRLRKALERWPDHDGLLMLKEELIN